MKNKAFSRLSLILFVTLLSSCKFFGMLKLPGILEVNVQSPGVEWDGYSIDLSGDGPDGSEVTREINWGHSTLGLNHGEWHLGIHVRNENDVLVGFGTGTVNIRSGKTTVTTLSVNNLEAGTLSTSINGLTNEITEGSARIVSAIVVGGSGSYEYSWYLNGGFLGSDVAVEIPETLSQGIYLLELIVTDPSEGNSGSDSVNFSVIDPFTKVEIARESFTLLWDAPADNGDIIAYKIYYREHGTEDWAQLETISASENLEFIITTSVLQTGQWDFGTTSINESGLESEIHSSLDENAIPSTGWYLDWVTS